MAEGYDVLEPVPDDAQRADRRLASRLGDLRGKTVLLLDNRKPKSFELLAKVGELLRSEHGASAVNIVSKTPDYSRMVTADELGENIGKAHLAITGLGD